MRLALQMKTRARERWEEVFRCEETLREKREKKRGKERKQREVLLFFLVLFVFGQRRDFFWGGGVHSPKNIITHFDETFAQYEQLSLSLYSKEHLSVIFSSSQRVIIVLLLVLLFI